MILYLYYKYILFIHVCQWKKWKFIFKIYRTFKTPDSIINNKFYTIDKNVAKDITNLVKNDGRFTPKKEQKQARQNLLKYCELDTFAMVKIWQN